MNTSTEWTRGVGLKTNRLASRNLISNLRSELDDNISNTFEIEKKIWLKVWAKTPLFPLCGLLHI